MSQFADFETVCTRDQQQQEHFCNCDDEGVSTITSTQQIACESACIRLLSTGPASGPTHLLREEHATYLRSGLGALPSSWSSLDASRTWLAYWCLQGLDILGCNPDSEPASSPSSGVSSRVISFLQSCASPSGGYGGGPGQAPHTAATFAAVMALLAIGTPEAYASIDRPGLISFYRRMKVPTTAAGGGSGTTWAGGFTVQHSGECDVRGTYTSLAPARLLCILTPDLADGCASFLASTQTYEGGFGGEPGNEAHGGYGYCALAGLHVLRDAARDVEGRRARQERCRMDTCEGDANAITDAEAARIWDEARHGLDTIDGEALRRWLAGKQMAVEGGFQGRTNKLVDSCYSFWQGACFHMLPDREVQGPPSRVETLCGGPGFDTQALQAYILRCCQDGRGGLHDKPGKSRDFYHTCYALSGLSISQWSWSTAHGVGASSGATRHTQDGDAEERESEGEGRGGDVEPVHPVYGLVWPKVQSALEYFSAQTLLA